MKTLTITDQDTGMYKEFDFNTEEELAVAISEGFDYFQVQTPEFSQQNEQDLNDIGLLSTSEMTVLDYFGNIVNKEYVLSIN